MGLQGYKTYILAALIACATAANYLGYIDESVYNTVLVLLGAGTAASLGAKVNRVDKKLLVILPLLFLYPTVAYAQSGYHLKADSKYRKAATDGTDLGGMVNWNKIEACAVKGANSPECLAFNTTPTPKPEEPKPDPDPVTPFTAGTMLAGKPFELLVHHDGKNIKWFTAKVNGAYANHVGTGSFTNGIVRIPINALSVGVHTITVEARNDTALVGTSTVTVVFVAPPPLSNIPLIQLIPR